MQRLTGLDAAFLALETPTAHMHVIGVAVLDPSTSPEPYTYERVRALFAARLDRIPELRRRVVEVPLGLHAPEWVEDPHFDLGDHVRRAALPAPGGPVELAAFAADVAGRRLDRRRPLWEMWVVEGLEHGHLALVAKFHHAMIDGAAGVEVLAALFDLDPNAELGGGDIAAAAPAWEPERIPGELEMVARAALSFAQRPAHAVKAAQRLGQGLTRAIRRVRDEALEVALPLTAPRLAMNRTISPHRRIAFASVPLAEVKAAKNALGVTVNDVVLAVTAGAMRTYLEHSGELPDRPLIAAVPTNERVETDRGMGNRVSVMFTALPVDVADAIGRVRAVQRSMSGAKGVHEHVGGATLAEWAEVAAPVLFAGAMRAYGRLRIGERMRPLVNCVVSNVPGPSIPVYLAGARLVSLHPLGPIFDDCGLNVTVISYLDHVDFGFLACRELLPDVDDLAAAVPDALAQLTKAVERS